MSWQEDAEHDTHIISNRLMRVIDKELKKSILEYHAELERIYNVLTEAKTLDEARRIILGPDPTE